MLIPYFNSQDIIYIHQNFWHIYFS